MSAESRETLIEAAVTAFREMDPSGRLLPAPAWCDLAPDDRARLFESTIASRRLEAAIDDRGLSSTARAVASRIRNLGQL